MRGICGAACVYDVTCDEARDGVTCADDCICVCATGDALAWAYACTCVCDDAYVDACDADVDVSVGDVTVAYRAAVTCVRSCGDGRRNGGDACDGTCDGCLCNARDEGEWERACVRRRVTGECERECERVPRRRVCAGVIAATARAIPSGECNADVRRTIR